jgi:hypothetical protein
MSLPRTKYVFKYAARRIRFNSIRKVMDILITHRCDYASAITSLSAPGESGKLLGIQLVLKVLPDKIRNKGESYLVEKLKPQRSKSSQLRCRARTTVAT